MKFTFLYELLLFNCLCRVHDVIRYNDCGAQVCQTEVGFVYLSHKKKSPQQLIKSLICLLNSPMKTFCDKFFDFDIRHIHQIPEPEDFPMFSLELIPMLTLAFINLCLQYLFLLYNITTI